MYFIGLGLFDFNFSIYLLFKCEIYYFIFYKNFILINLLITSFKMYFILKNEE
jgi:hypothetical protein